MTLTNASCDAEFTDDEVTDDVEKQWLRDCQGYEGLPKPVIPNHIFHDFQRKLSWRFHLKFHLFEV